MGVIRTAMSVSLDGYVAGPSSRPDSPLGDGGDVLFRWLDSGDTRSAYFPFRMWPASRQVFDGICATNGAIVTGRHTHDVVGGWGGSGPQADIPLFVMTHRVDDAPWPEYTYTDAPVEDVLALARTKAEGRDISLMGTAPVQLALAAGLLDEIHLHGGATLLGGGARLLEGVAVPQLELLRVVEAPDVTHLSYRVCR
ncbi:dihydrofolate reductase family protein [uncultured Jatrophihabitans sp.]|uniref:dihydrofolate reductase family protein n=1 Tax=uncultured Jatrophihabitans sp. TaxID=1610747 RepID=UPI0035CBF11B